MRLRRRSRPKADEADEADEVIDLRERLAPYGASPKRPARDVELDDKGDERRSRPRPLRARPLGSSR